MTSQQYHAFVDWDDTLKVTNALYDAASRENAELVLSSLPAPKVTVEKIVELVHDIDLQKAKREGLNQNNYPVAWAEGYEEVAAMHGVQPLSEVAAALVERAARVLSTPQEDYPGAQRLIEYLRSFGFEITIWTAGVDSIQRERIERAGYHRLVDRIYVVPDKSPTALQIAMENRRRENTVVIGNSPRADISPALRLGIWAVHVRQSTWAYDQAEVDSAHPKYQGTDSLLHVPTILGRLFRLSAVG